jgi:phage terminase small subunit
MRHRGSGFGGSKDRSHKQKSLKKKKRKDVEISCNEFEGYRASYRPPEKRGIDTRKTESSVNPV